jgi:hypothetical protein
MDTLKSDLEQISALLQHLEAKAVMYGENWSDPQWQGHNFEVSILEEALANLG